MNKHQAPATQRAAASAAETAELEADFHLCIHINFKNRFFSLEH
jgi:hypothetical protein